MSEPPRILCIEDDHDILELLTEVLQEAGFVTETADNGLAGLDAIRSAPDLVLCDIDMPGLTGFEVLERLRREKPRLQDIPFLFLTAFGARDNQMRAYQLGCDDYVTKPIDFDLLVEIVRSKLQRRRPQPDEPHFRLTPREAEVLTWVAKGKASSDISALVRISERTVNFHIDNVMRKAGVASRIQAAVLCIRLGLITVD
ncbi:MAG TPA: response regulator transcription factor [Microvirga sp.]|jgi:DNA-binding NarL/FixJ family response regulator|nr:response regulator transcription factor [Microvirga sp.]